MIGEGSHKYPQIPQLWSGRDIFGNNRSGYRAPLTLLCRGRFQMSHLREEAKYWSWFRAFLHPAPFISKSSLLSLIPRISHIAWMWNYSDPCKCLLDQYPPVLLLGHHCESSRTPKPLCPDFSRPHWILGTAWRVNSQVPALGPTSKRTELIKTPLVYARSELSEGQSKQGEQSGVPTWRASLDDSVVWNCQPELRNGDGIG